jgi:hypothetical protein
MVLFLKNRFKIVISLLLITVLFSQCQESKNEKVEVSKNSPSCSIKKPLNPNGDSELALLMREMYDTSASIKTTIINGESPSNFPQSFNKIQSAKATDPSVKNETFKVLAEEYLKGLKVLYNSPVAELKTNFNESVQKCINCHEAFCPGPIQKIVKLKF